MISIKLLCNFIEITLPHGCSPVNSLYIFRKPFSGNTSGGLFLNGKSVYQFIEMKELRYIIKVRPVSLKVLSWDSRFSIRSSRTYVKVRNPHGRTLRYEILTVNRHLRLFTFSTFIHYISCFWKLIFNHISIKSVYVSNQSDLLYLACLYRVLITQPDF